MGQVCPGLEFDTVEDWTATYSGAGLVEVETEAGPFEMMTPRGFLVDGGLARSLGIMGRVGGPAGPCPQDGLAHAPDGSRALSGYIVVAACRPAEAPNRAWFRVHQIALGVDGAVPRSFGFATVSLEHQGSNR
jgi:hypothetical protein